jgi:non-homologous end joining protein Ku
VSTAVHSFVRQTINEAKKTHDADKFAEVYQKKEAEITERGKKKAAERKRGARKASRKVNLPRKGTRKTGSE